MCLIFIYWILIQDAVLRPPNESSLLNFLTLSQVPILPKLQVWQKPLIFIPPYMPNVLGTFLIAVAKCHTERNLREGSLIWLTVERIQPIEARNSWWRDKQRTSVIWHLQSESRERWVLALSFLSPSHSIWETAQEQRATFRMSLLVSLKPI